MNREYVGRCDNCGRNIYKDDMRYTAILRPYGTTLSLCSHCCWPEPVQPDIAWHGFEQYEDYMK